MANDVLEVAERLKKQTLVRILVTSGEALGQLALLPHDFPEATVRQVARLACLRMLAWLDGNYHESAKLHLEGTAVITQAIEDHPGV